MLKIMSAVLPYCFRTPFTESSSLSDCGSFMLERVTSHGPTRAGGKECSCNKDCLSGERHAGTFERNNTKDDPRAVGWDQANQSIGQRSVLHLRKGRPKPSFLNYPLRQPRCQCCA